MKVMYVNADKKYEVKTVTAINAGNFSLEGGAVMAEKDIIVLGEGQEPLKLGNELYPPKEAGKIYTQLVKDLLSVAKAALKTESDMSKDLSIFKSHCLK